jgi:glucosamine--fructose-6-phosphate aminotransferase (isomerizing)
MDRFLEEILSQPQVLRSILNRYLNDEMLFQPMKDTIEKRDMIIMTGMGSSQYAFYPACIYMNEYGLTSFVFEASELLHYYKDLISPRVLLWIASQSGETIEVKKLLDKVGNHSFTIGVTNDVDGYVARNCDLPLFLYAGREEGPSSKTYTSTLLVNLISSIAITTGISDKIANELRGAVSAIDSFLERWEEEIDRLVEFLGVAESIFVLGRGPSMASVMTGSLILKEVAKVHAEGMSSAQFRHGPLELASPGFAAIVFASSGRTKSLNVRLVQNIAEFGGKVVLIGEGEDMQLNGILTLPLPAIKEIYAPLTEIVPIQLLARRLAIEKGLNPGKFERAGKVTRHE